MTKDSEGQGLLVTLQHAFDQISKRTPEVLSTGQIVFVNEQNVMLEARVQMWFQSQLDNDRVMMTVYVGIHTVQALEELTYQGWKRLGKGNACKQRSIERAFEEFKFGTDRFDLETLPHCLCYLEPSS